MRHRQHNYHIFIIYLNYLVLGHGYSGVEIRGMTGQGSTQDDLGGGGEFGYGRARDRWDLGSRQEGLEGWDS